MINLNEIPKLLSERKSIFIVYFLGSIPITVNIWNTRLGLFYRISIENENAYKQAKNWHLFNHLFLTGTQFSSIEKIDSDIYSLCDYLKNRVKYKTSKKYETLYFDDNREYLKTMAYFKIT